MQRVLIGFAQGVAQEFVAHEATIDVAVLGVTARPRMGGQGAMAEDAQAVAAWPGIDGARFGEEIVAENGAGTSARVAFCQVQADAPVVRERESDFRVGQRDAFDGFGAMGELGRFGFEEFAACRRVVVKVTHFDDRAGGERRRFRRCAGFSNEAPGVAGTMLAAGQREAGHGSNRGQRLAAKAESGHLLQIIERGDLRGGMAG